MKNKIIAVLTVLMLTGLGLSWRYLLQQLEPSRELKINQNTVEHLTEFEELKELFSQEIMRLSSGLERTFEPTNSAFKAMKKEQTILNELSRHVSTTLAIHMDKINTTVDELEFVFEDYKSNYALAANSAIYVPSLYRQVRVLLNKTQSSECAEIRSKLNSWLDEELSNVLFMYSDQPQRRMQLPLNNTCISTTPKLKSLLVSLDNHINVFHLTRESNLADVVRLTDTSLEALLVNIKLKNIQQLSTLAHEQERQLRSFYVVFSLFVLALVVSVSMAVSYYRKNRINQQRSLTDPLTRIGNRLSFDQDLQSLVEQYRLGDQAFSLFYIDLDNFKSVNDNLSHDDGDRLLIKITKEMKQVLRSVDHLYRIGGDEFILLSQSRTDRDALSTISQKLIDCCSQSVPCGRGRFIDVSASVGVVVMRADITDVKMLIQEADGAMYKVKHEGKGNFVFAEDIKKQAETDQPA